MGLWQTNWGRMIGLDRRTAENIGRLDLIQNKSSSSAGDWSLALFYLFDAHKYSGGQRVFAF
jgi:hypothetical protein